MLVRKVSRAKWGKDAIIDEIPSADAITGCLRTMNNELSVWWIRGDDELEDAVLALACKFTRIDTIDIVMIDDSALSISGLNLKLSDGNTVYRAFSDRHRDITDLDYNSLGKVANLVRNAFIKEKFKRISKSYLIKIIRDGINQNKISDIELDEKLRISLGYSLAASPSAPKP